MFATLTARNDGDVGAAARPGCGVQAREAYERALELEPDNQGLQEAQHKADVAARKAEAKPRHRFMRPQARSAARAGAAGSHDSQSAAPRAAVKAVLRR